MVTGLGVLPMLLGDDARRRDAVNALSLTQFLGLDSRALPAYCAHRYSNSQAWNADRSLLLIGNGCSGFCFLHRSTYAPPPGRTQVAVATGRELIVRGLGSDRTARRLRTEKAICGGW
jgi:hypothetical protein